MLTPAQKITLKTAIQADSAANALFVSGDLGGLADYLNTQASPTFTVWKTSVLIGSIGASIVASELSGLSTLNATRLQTLVMLLQDGVNPTRVDTRAFFDDIFSGAGGVNTRAALLALWKRLASRVEKIFATGTGSDAVPAILSFEGTLTYQDLIGL
jgi:hypothetical protein